MGRYLLEHGNEEQVTVLILEQTVGVSETCSVGFEVYNFHNGTDNPNSFYCCTVHFDNTYVLITNKCTSLLHI